MLWILCVSLCPVVAAYWFDPRIHELGHLGWRGRLHAECTPLTTRLIDRLAYNGVDIRHRVLEGPSTIDFGCGVGLSTPLGALGVDTSRAMIGVARRRSNGSSSFAVGNAETYGVDDSFDAATAIFLMHEVPVDGWRRILDNMRRVSRDKIVVVDIHPSKRPSQWMLRGEPYLTDYLALFDSAIREWADDVGDELVYDEPVAGRASRWEVRRSELSPLHDKEPWSAPYTCPPRSVRFATTATMPKPKRRSSPAGTNFAPAAWR